ncbi:MAG: discoidin domain-containing protein [Spirochaetes bacterium]|nr:discoidin domain-containing protein [Spirochaetota bacterium]
MFKYILITLFLLNISTGYSISIIETTFNDPSNLLTDEGSYSASGNIKQSEQFITINLGSINYVKEITIHWNKNEFSMSYQILRSTDYLNWSVVQKNINAGKAPVKGNNRVQTIDLKNTAAQFIRIQIPQHSKFKGTKDNSIEVANIQCYYTTDIKPKIQKVAVHNIRNTEATVKWDTDYETLGQIRFGLDPKKITDIHTEYFYNKTHALTLKNLLKGKKYYFQIINQMPDSKYITSQLLSFKTSGIPLPEIEEIIVKKREYNTVTLSVKPNISTYAEIKYGTDPDKLEKKVSVNKLSRLHTIKIKGLYPLTRYYSEITLTDSGKNRYTEKYDFETGEYNIAMNKKVEGTFKSTFIADVFKLEGDIQKRANDGSFDYKTGMAVSFDPAGSEQFLLIDLGSIEEIEKIITYWRALAYPYLYFIYFSTDKKKWQKYNKMVNLKNEKITFIQGSGIPMIIGTSDPENTKTRYVKIVIPKGSPFYKKYTLYNFLQLMEIKIYGKYR